MTPSPDLTAHALTAAERGWHVFPLRPRDKRPALHGEHDCPRTGLCAEQHLGWEPRATTDPGRIRACWAAGPFNVAVACGPSRLVVLDLDAPKDADDTPPPEIAGAGIVDGLDVFAALCERHGQPFPAETYGVRTRNGGWQLYYNAPPQVELRNTCGDKGRGLGWHIDTRAAGGYVVAAGSTVAPGRYTVMHDGPLADLPAWLTALLTPKPLAAVPPSGVRVLRGSPSAYTSAALEREIENVLAALPGARNHTLYNAAYALGRHVGDGRLPRDLAANALHSAGEQTGLPGYEIFATVRGGLDRGARDPKRLAA
ncbi:bifunctional DNA primase/polymerase [Streptacidiphilus carbonis]|uniref:bifunctional DNA primase/polymerase n=1 Tax=Streptacidiphilus carbonis TaxID=105422 RepID=UPI0005AAB728|nr:bifunctional DNA primase/polymerase [Streptacidiphilus carbonis]